MVNKIHCAHILVKSEKEAKEVLEKLKSGKKFSVIAKSVSGCSSRKKGGDLGFFTRGKMVKDFEKSIVVFSKIK